MWCPRCQSLAPDLEILHQTYGSQGVTVITVIYEDGNHLPPDASDLTAWTNQYGIDHLVLADPTGDVTDLWGGPALPSGWIVGRDLVVTWHRTGTAFQNGMTAQVQAAL